MTDRTITEELFQHIMKCHPGAKVEHKGGVKYVHVPDYDVHTDTATWHLRRVQPADAPPKIKPGDVLGVEKTEGRAEIVDLNALLNQPEVTDGDRLNLKFGEEKE